VFPEIHFGYVFLQVEMPSLHLPIPGRALYNCTKVNGVNSEWTATQSDENEYMAIATGMTTGSAFTQ